MVSCNIVLELMVPYRIVGKPIIAVPFFQITLQNQLQMNHVSERSTLLDGLYLTSKWFHLTLELHRYLVQQSSAAGQTLL
jgi:hypothetical protein